MRNTWPVWAPLKFQYDQQVLLREALSLTDRFIPLPAHISTIKDRARLGYWDVVPAEFYDDTSYWSAVPGETKSNGTKDNWYGLNLTTVDGIKSSLMDTGANLVQGKYKGQWEWNEKYKSAISTIISTVDQLPFEHYDTVRIMTLPPKAYGPVHIDKPEGESEHSEKGFFGLTLQLDSGGAPLEIRDTDGRRHDVNAPAFMFLDTVAHGVRQVEETRCLIRAYGKINVDQIKYMIDWKNAIW